ncbi:MAG: glycosyltransferase, partial [bacterium]|nr:glycosyltransferase [bacterium]
AVASKVGGIPEIISDGENGFLVEPKNSKMLAEKINLLLGNERLKAEFSRSGREIIQAEFSLGWMLARTQEAYIGIV